MTTTFVAVVCFLVGLIAGSFVNVVALRVPAGESITHPRSRCPHCGHQIRARDNVPVVSWIVLKGRCRDCGQRISARYPIVELSTALLFAATPFVVGVSWSLFAYLWFVGLTVALTVTDIDHKLIPNRIIWPGGWIGLGLLAVGGVLDGDLWAFGRGVGGAFIYATLFLIIYVIAPRGGFGQGDIRLGFVLGLFTAYQSWGVLVVAIVGGIFLGGITSVLILLTRIRGRKDHIPFGPYMVAGAYLALAVGAEIAEWYLG